MNTKTSVKRGVFVGVRKDQLGARLLMMMNCIRLAEEYNTDYRVNWFPRGAAAPKLDQPVELFTQEYMDAHFVDDETFVKLEQNIAPIRKFMQDSSPERLEKHLAAGNNILLDEGFEVLTFEWEDADGIRKNCKGLLEQMGFQQPIRSKMDLIRSAMASDGSNTVAYHIRRGDILNETPWKHGIWRAKIEPDELYYRHIDKSGDGLALVFSDQSECIARMQTKYNTVRSMRDIIDLDDCQDSQRDFLELYAMSMAGTIVAPVISAFSSAAARLSGRERARFVDVLTGDQINEAYDNVVGRFENGVEQFVNPSEAVHIFSKLSRHLAINDREVEAYNFGKMLLETNADNAFLPMLHAINCIYTQNWEEADSAINKAISIDGQWNENLAISLALKSLVSGALGNAKSAREHWIRAYWQKPLLPDVTIIGTHLFDQRRLKPMQEIPFDPSVLNAIRMPYSHKNVLVAQRKILGRRVLDLSCLTIDWPYFVLDRKAQRILENPAELRALNNRLAKEDPENAEIRSFRGLLHSYLGNHNSAMALTQGAVETNPKSLLFRKRYAEALWNDGKKSKALDQLNTLCDIYPNNGYALFLKAHYTERFRGVPDALEFYEKAAKLDDTTAAIHAALGEAYKTLGQKAKAARKFKTASEIAPAFQKFKNQYLRMQSE